MVSCLICIDTIIDISFFWFYLPIIYFLCLLYLLVELLVIWLLGLCGNSLSSDIEFMVPSEISKISQKSNILSICRVSSLINCFYLKRISLGVMDLLSRWSDVNMWFIRHLPIFSQNQKIQKKNFLLLHWSELAMFLKRLIFTLKLKR